MYLLYMDESGTARGRGERYFVVGGIALHEQDCWPFARSLEHLVQKTLPTNLQHLELHASRMWSGRSEWSHVSRSLRDRAITAVFEHMGTWLSPDGRAPRYFAVAVRKDSFPSQDILQKAHQELFLRFNGLLGRLSNVQGRRHRALVIADNSSYERLVQSLLPRWKLQGTHAGRLHAFAEVPLYVDSRASRIIQVADFLAWGVFQHYERGRPDFLRLVNHRIDASEGVQHGLTHLVRAYRRCPCVPCASRRVGTVSSTVVALRL